MNERPNSNTNEDIVLDQYSYKTLHKLIKSGMWKMYCSRDFQIVGVEWSDELRRMIGYTNEQDFPNRYDMILMDVQMPVMNGYEAAQRIRVSTNKEGKKIPILAMTVKREKV